MKNSKDTILTTKEAYRAMYAFLEIQYKISKTVDVEWLLGTMQLLADGDSADPAMWEDWEDAINYAKENPNNANLKLS